MFGPGPDAMPFGPAFAVGVTTSEILPLEVSCPILLDLNSVIQRFASEPSAMPTG